MTAKPQIIVINDSLEQFAPAYVERFVKAYWKYGPAYGAPANAVVPHLALYAATIEENIQAICDTAAAHISNYLNRYKVATEDSVDEYKIIYFLGRAIHQYLPDFQALRGVHLFIMIGMLDFRLRRLGINKPQLTTALCNLIRTGYFESELGPTGCYLIYKCASTVVHDAIPIPFPHPGVPAKGTGLDTPSTTLTAKVLGGEL